MQDAYKKYLQSSHWKELRRKYFRSGLPKKCLGCKSPKIDLHHRSYSRLGHEDLFDLIPLCRFCHDAVHAYLKKKNLPYQATHKALREIFGWSRAHAIKVFRPFTLTNNFGWVSSKIENAKTKSLTPATYVNVPRVTRLNQLT